MKLEANITRTAPSLGFICDVTRHDIAIAEAEDYDFRMISPGYYLCIHGENAYAMSAYLAKTGCACADMTYRCKGNEACKHIQIFNTLNDLPSKPIDKDMEQLLKAAGWIGRKLHPPAQAKKPKLPNIHDSTRKPQPQAAATSRHTSRSAREVRKHDPGADHQGDAAREAGDIRTQGRPNGDRRSTAADSRGDRSMIDSQVNWIQVRRERRIRIARATREDVEDYILIQRLPNTTAMSLYDLPEHWMVGGVAYDFTSGTFMFQILSPEFDPSLEGAVNREVEKTHHIIEITRRAVSA